VQKSVPLRVWDLCNNQFFFRQSHNAERIFGSPVTRGQHVGPHEYLDIDSRSAADVLRSLRSRPLCAAP
jgi:hypothetical protein